jgi:hypothetical protein
MTKKQLATKTPHTLDADQLRNVHGGLTLWNALTSYQKLTDAERDLASAPMTPTLTSKSISLGE